jgi:hypothetical protein
MKAGIWIVAIGTVAVGGRVEGAVLTVSPSSARAAALGDGSVAYADDASALWENPALLADLPWATAAAFHRPFGDGAALSALTLSRHMGGVGGLATGVRVLGAGTIDRVDVEGMSLGAVSPRDQLWAAGWGRRWSGNHPARGWAWGLSGQFLESRLTSSVRGIAGDAGVLSPIMAGRWRWGAVAQNLGRSPGGDAAPVDWPRTFKVGAAADVGRWRWSAEARRRGRTSPEWASGVEGVFVLAGRTVASVRLGGSTAPRDEAMPVAVGFGVAWGDLRLDYFYRGANAAADFHGAGLTWFFRDRRALPPALAALVERGRRFLEQGRFPEAVLAFDEALAIDSRCAPAWDGLETAGRRMRGR